MPRLKQQDPIIREQQYAQWGREHGMLGSEVKNARRLGMLIASRGVHECNGDPCQGVKDKTDKNANAQEWGRLRDLSISQLRALVERFDFEVELNGLYPTLRKNGRDYYLPYDND